MNWPHLLYLLAWGCLGAALGHWLGPKLRELYRLARGGCRHKWEVIEKEIAVVVEGDPYSMTGMCMPVCWMRVCKDCLRPEVSHLKHDRPHAGWHEVVRMTEEDHYNVQWETPLGQVGTMCPKGTPVVRRLR